MRYLASLAVIAFALTACGSGGNSSATAAPTATPGPGDLVVHAAGVNAALRAVAFGPLTATEKRLFAANMARNRKRPYAFDGLTVRRIINLELAYQQGQHDIVKANEQEEAYKREISPLLGARVLAGKDAGDRIIFTVSLHNKTAKAIDHVDLELDVYDATTKRAIGHIELNLNHHLAAHATDTFAVPVHYRQFDADTGMMMGAANHPKTFDVDAVSIEFVDGTSIGEESD